MKKFLYFLVEKDGRSRQIVNGVVTSLTTPKPLPQAPDGNQEISIGWERSELYHGNIRNFSLSLGFVMDGATILRNDWYKFNIDRELYLLIKRLTYEWTALTFKEYYKQLYKGQLDFSTAEDSQGEYRMSMGIMEGGLQRLLKANESTQFEIPFDMQAKNIRMDGMIIGGAFKWVIVEYTSGSSGALPTMVKQGEEHAVPGIYVSDVMGGFPLTFSAINADNTEYFLACLSTPIGGQARVTGQFTLSNPLPAFPMNLVIWVYNTIAGTLVQQPLFVGPEAQIINVDIVLPLVEGDRWFLEIDEYHYDSFLNVDVQGRFETTVIKGFTLYDTGRKLAEKITGNPDDFDSSLLLDLVGQRGFDIILTSGDGVRGLENASLKTSWRDYWKFVDVLCKAQMTITDKIRIENRVTAYDNTQAAIPLGEVKKLKITPALDKMATSIKVGHQEQQVDDTNGKYDFNGYMIFNTPVKAIPDKQVDLQSPYKASPYEIEATRANYEGKTTTDKDTDNDVFALAVTPDDPDNTFTTTATFAADGAPFSPGQPLLAIVAANPEIRPGMKLRITGSALNNQDVTVAAAATWFFGQLIFTNEPLVDEASVNITIEVLEGQIYSLDRSIAVTQLITPDDVDAAIKASIFNIPLTPKRILLTHADWLAGALYNYAPGELRYTYANRNSQLIAGGITERADLEVVDMGAPMFKPYYLEFDTISPVDMVEILEANPNPKFSFTWLGVSYTGFFIRGGIALNDLEEQTFKLLACPDADLLPLI